MSTSATPPLPWPADASVWRKCLIFLKISPISALLIYTVVSLMAKENYPLSNYPMYSNPTSRPLKFQFLADASGNPLPVGWHTGVTPSQVGKMTGNRKQELSSEKAAATSVLEFLRTQNAKRKGRELPARIQLIETSIGFDHNQFVETNRVLAEHQRP